MRRRILPLLLVSVLALVAGCQTNSQSGSETTGDQPGRETRTSAIDESRTSAAEPASPDEPMSWGPTPAELEEAQGLVAGWRPAQLAGQVIVARYFGNTPEEPANLVRDLHLAGVAVGGYNVVDAAQVRATTAAVTRAHAADGRSFPPVIGVDQEGGVVAHLDGVATTFPPFQEAGDAITAGARQGRTAVRNAAVSTAMELRMLGFTWVFAPVADVTIGAADPTIGSRSPSQDPKTAAAAIGAAVPGYDQAGVVSTTKHFPGHGSVTADSHEVLPKLDASLETLRERDLVPFEAAVDAGAPAIMMGHLDARAIAPGVPTSLAPEAYDFLRDELGFEGVAITDSMGMGAVMRPGKPAVDAINAGADLLLMPADARRTHAVVTEAIEKGVIPRERVEEAAARVVALQLWQQRQADAVPLPAPAVVTGRAQAAATALDAAGE
ncbi:MAG: glycoside hydrolase family 3 N-terminal domain-containing protein [Nocardioides sp.]